MRTGVREWDPDELIDTAGEGHGEGVTVNTVLAVAAAAVPEAQYDGSGEDDSVAELQRDSVGRRDTDGEPDALPQMEDDGVTDGELDTLIL